MGLFSGIARCCAKVYSGVKTVVKKTAEVVSTAAKTTWNGVKKIGAVAVSAWKKFTGQENEEKAEALLEDLRKRAEKANADFQKFASKIGVEIDAELEKVNDFRNRFNFKHFRRFELLMENFASWNVANMKNEPGRKINGKKVEAVKSRAELFKIDFRNHPISSNLKAICTFGFLTRKRAKETLLAVQEEEHRLDLDLERLNAEKTRLSLVLKSLQQVVFYFSGFSRIYNQLLDELDYSVNYLRTSRHMITGNDAADKLELEMLPRRHLLCVQCAEKATRILYEMGQQRYVTQENNTVCICKDQCDALSDQKAAFDHMNEQLIAA